MQTDVAIKNFLAHCHAQNLKPNSITWYQNKLCPFAAAYPKLPLKPEPIESFLASVGGSPYTRHAYYRALRAFYKKVK